MDMRPVSTAASERLTMSFERKDWARLRESARRTAKRLTSRYEHAPGNPARAADAERAGEFERLADEIDAMLEKNS
jgi:hypothetical protein